MCYKFHKYTCKVNTLQPSADAHECRLRGKEVLREIFDEDFPNPKHRFFSYQDKNYSFIHEYVESKVDDLFIIRVGYEQVVELPWNVNEVRYFYLYVIMDFRADEPRFMIEVNRQCNKSVDVVETVFDHTLNKILNKSGWAVSFEKQHGESNLPDCLREVMEPLINKDRSIEGFYKVPNIYEYLKMKEENKNKNTNNNKTTPGITVTGGITINGPMFDLRNNQQAQTNQPEEKHQAPADDFEYVNLVFFDTKLFGTYERQLALSKLLKEASKRMDLDTGRDLVAVYIAYHFLIGQQSLLQGYTDFIQDADFLMPKMLGRIKEDESRYQRYKRYTDTLAIECKKWFIEDNCLPNVNVWKSNQYRYNVDDTRQKQIQQLVTDLLLGMKNIITT